MSLLSKLSELIFGAPDAKDEMMFVKEELLHNLSAEASHMLNREVTNEEVLNVGRKFKQNGIDSGDHNHRHSNAACIHLPAHRRSSAGMGGV